MSAGRSLPTTWMAVSVVTRVPFGVASTAFSRLRACRLDQAGTGDRKRKPSEP